MAMCSVEVEMYRSIGPTGDKIESQKKVVYETEVNGVRTLDLYSGWAVEGEEHKFKLQRVPVKVCSLVLLEKLWLSHNDLRDLPLQLDQLVNLRELFLHYNSFKTIPSCVFRLLKLEILWLSSNELKEVPPQISQLKALRQLHLEHNNLDQFQESLCDLPSLEVLYLNHNYLVSFSSNINNLAKTLRRLYLNMNKITTIPETICFLEKLEILYLHDNRIAVVPPSKFDVFCSKLKETNNAIIQVKNNPYVLPRVKLSVGGPPSTLQIQANPSRRYSDDFRQRSLTQPTVSEHRYSVPSVDSMPTGTSSNRDHSSGRKSMTIQR